MPGKSKRQGFEKVTCDGVSYLFKSDFSFLAEMTEITGVDPFEAFAQINAGTATPDLILGVLVASIHSKENNEIDPSRREQECRDLITLKGFQECYVLAKLMLSWGMIGDVKKHETHRWEVVQEIMENLNVFPLMNSKKLHILWGSILMNSGICAWLLFKTYAPHIF